jgi:hypothetical protein
LFSPQIIGYCTHADQYSASGLEALQMEQDILPRIREQQEITRLEKGLLVAPRAALFQDGGIAGSLTINIHQKN